MICMEDKDFYRGHTHWVEKLKELVDEMHLGTGLSEISQKVVKIWQGTASIAGCRRLLGLDSG